jgi:hypothetical protein
MNGRLDAAVAAIRAEMARQAANGDASYRGVSRDGRDRIEGCLDLPSIARAVLSTLGDPGQPGERASAPGGAEFVALSIEADERQTERQAPNDASPGEAGHGNGG